MSPEEILSYWRVLKKRLWLIALLCVATIGTMFYQQKNVKPVYRAGVRFQITSPPRGEVILYGGYSTPRTRDEIPFIRGDFLNVLTSGAVARQVIEELGLQGMSTSDITSNIQTEEIEGSDFTRVMVYADSPQLAADIANAVVQEALKQYGQLRANSATLSKNFITDELAATRQELELANEAWTTFKLENRVGILNSMIDEQQQLLRSLRLRRDDAWATGAMDEVYQYDQVIAQRNAELQDLVRLSSQYDSLQVNVQQLQETFNFLLDKETQAKLTENEALTVGFIQVLDQARPSSYPVSSSNIKIMILGGMVSLAVGIVIAFVWEFMTAKEDREVQITQVNVINAETGAYNESFFLQRLGVEMARARRNQYPLSMALLDVDHMDVLQKVDVTREKDEILRKTTLAMRQHLREEDLVAYFGDATFAFLLPDMSGESAKAMMEQLQMRLAWTPFVLEQSGVRINLNCVAGVAVFDHDTMERDELVLKANQALQRAGANGHGQAHLVTDEPNGSPERTANEQGQEQIEHRKIKD